MVTISSRATRLLLIGLFIGISGAGQGFAQGPPEQPSQQQRGEENRVPDQIQDDSFVDGVTAAIGLAIYQGDFSRNPNRNVLKYVAGNGNLAARVGVDHRFGAFEQYGLGLDLGYNRIVGKDPNGLGFEANSITLDFYADYELPYIKQGFLRVFIGGGPNLVLSPSYNGIPAVRNTESFEENVQQKGTRVIGSFKAGIMIMDSFRIGTRVASTDLLDGYKGFESNGVPDFVSFVNIGYRFGVR